MVYCVLLTLRLIIKIGYNKFRARLYLRSSIAHCCFRQNPKKSTWLQMIMGTDICTMWLVKYALRFNMLTFWQLAAAKTIYLITARRSRVSSSYRYVLSFFLLHLAVHRCWHSNRDVSPDSCFTSLHHSSRFYTTQALGTKGAGVMAPNMCRNLVSRFPTYFWHSCL